METGRRRGKKGEAALTYVFLSKLEVGHSQGAGCERVSGLEKFRPGFLLGIPAHSTSFFFWQVVEMSSVFMHFMAQNDMEQQ